MNTFGDFLYSLRKEKNMTQADLAASLGVTNKAVSKWETDEAMPETTLLLPISKIFGVTVDELLNGERASGTSDERSSENVVNDDNEEDNGHIDIKKYLFARGKELDESKTLSEKICGAICGILFFSGVVAYLLIGALSNQWHPYWVIIPACALSCGIVGVISDLCNVKKRNKKIEKGENPYTGAACGIIMLTCIIVYMLLGATMGLWHPLWLIVAVGGALCAIVGTVGDIFVRGKKDDNN